MFYWQDATPEIADLPILHGLFSGMKSAEAYELMLEVRNKFKEVEIEDNEAKLIGLIEAILSMAERPGEIPPFVPKIKWVDGSRSAQLEDFGGAILPVISALHTKTDHPVAQARISHVAFCLDRRDRASGLTALNAYLSIAEQLDKGELIARDGRGILGRTGEEVLESAFSVRRLLGGHQAELSKLNDLTLELLERASGGESGYSLRIFAELALKENPAKAEIVASLIEAFIAKSQGFAKEPTVHLKAEMWLLSSRAHKIAKNAIAEKDARLSASECYASYALDLHNNDQSAVLAAHWMEIAIATIRSLPDVRKRRKELLHKLADIQGDICYELTSFPHSIDASDIINNTREDFIGISLKEALKRLTLIGGLPPLPEKLKEEAKISASKYVSASMFPAQYIDADGRTVARSQAGSSGGDDNETDEFDDMIMLAESARRSVLSQTGIEVARHAINCEHHVSEDFIFSILAHSPFVPDGLHNTMARGFSAWIYGDKIAALYILTPMLEGVLLKILELHGHDISLSNDSERTQERIAINAIFGSLRPVIDEAIGRRITDDIERVFLKKSGPCIRHGVAHASLPDGAAYSADANYACWLIWMLVTWQLVPVWDKINTELT